MRRGARHTGIGQAYLALVRRALYGPSRRSVRTLRVVGPAPAGTSPGPHGRPCAHFIVETRPPRPRLLPRRGPRRRPDRRGRGGPRAGGPDRRDRRLGHLELRRLLDVLRHRPDRAGHGHAGPPGGPVHLRPGVRHVRRRVRHRHGAARWRDPLPGPPRRARRDRLRPAPRPHRPHDRRPLRRLRGHGERRGGRRCQGRGRRRVGDARRRPGDVRGERDRRGVARRRLLLLLVVRGQADRDADRARRVARAGVPGAGDDDHARRDAGGHLRRGHDRDARRDRRARRSGHGRVP